MEILLLRTWETNIGNAIIEKGAKAMVERAFPDASVTESSSYSNYLGARREDVSVSKPHQSYIARRLKDFIRERKHLSKVAVPLYDRVFQHDSDVNNDSAHSTPHWIKHWERGNTDLSNVAEYHDPDLVVLPGCVLGSGLAVCRPILAEFHKRDIPIIIAGGGGGKYDPPTQEFVTDIFDDVGVSVFMARDRVAFDRYSNLVDHSYQGIDCGLFINDWYKPPESTETFSAITFDKTEEPTIDTEHRTIRLNHAPYNNPEMGLSNKFSAIFDNNYYEPIYNRFFESECPFVSDNVRDYLFVYGNSEIVHSDRIHACIPGIAYGNSAKFYFETPRANLFDNLEQKGVISGYKSGSVIESDTDVLESEKKKQIQFLRDAVEQTTEIH